MIPFLDNLTTATSERSNPFLKTEIIILHIFLTYKCHPSNISINPYKRVWSFSQFFSISMDASSSFVTKHVVFLEIFFSGHTFLAPLYLVFHTFLPLMVLSPFLLWKSILYLTTKDVALWHIYPRSFLTVGLSSCWGHEHALRWINLFAKVHLHF